MKKLLLIFTLLIIISCFTACGEVADGEYEVISVASYTIVTGADENGPIEETRLAFIYMDNGSPQMISGYYENTNLVNYKDYIIVGDTNKYVVVHGYRKVTEYLYLTQETYDMIFNAEDSNG